MDSDRNILHSQLIIRELHLKGVLGTFELELMITFDHLRIKIPNKNVTVWSPTFLTTICYTL